MMITQEIQHFNIGISQQPPALRSPEQLTSQINCLSSESRGLIKRPPSIHVAKLSDLQHDKPYIHMIERDKNEKYIVVLNGKTCRVFDRAGQSHNVVLENTSYLLSDDPRQDLVIVTVADYSFILNKKRIPAMKQTTTPDTWASQGTLVRVKAGHYGHRYSVSLSGSILGEYTTPDGSEASHANHITTSNIINSIATAIGANYPGRFTISTGEGWMYIVDSTGSAGNITASDGYDNADMITIYQNVAKFSDLPRTAPHGFTVLVQGELASNADDYYLNYDSSKKLWVETCQPNLLYQIDPSTMPHALISNADGTFTFKGMSWDDRKIGDDDSNPIPSFIGKAIQDIFFFKNRFGMIAGEQVVLSESGSFFNFWMSTATNVLDTDTIDTCVSSSSITILRHAVPFNEALLLISDDTQFMLQSEGVLTPRSITINPVSTSPCDYLARPIMAGRRIYYTAKRSDYTTVREFYTVGTVDDAKLTTDITSHVPEFIPNGVYKMVSSTTENLLFLFSEALPGAIYVYKYLFGDEKRLQASWSAWWFGDEAEVVGGGILENQLYLIIKRDGETYLEKINLAVSTLDYTKEPYRIHVDRKAVGTISEYNNDYDYSLVDVYSIYKNTNPMSSETRLGIVMLNSKYIEFSPADLKNGKLKIEGDWRGVEFAIGQIYECSIVLSPIFITTEKGRITTGRLQLKYMEFTYQETGFFHVTVETSGREFCYTNGNHLGVETVISKYKLKSSNLRFPLHTRNTNATISLTSDNPTPFNIVNAIWEGE